MGTDNLEKIFSPEAEAVIGATERKSSVGAAVLQNLIGSSYQGRIFPVNPNHQSISGLPCYANLAHLPDKVDLAVYVIVIRRIAETLAQAAGPGPATWRKTRGCLAWEGSWAFKPAGFRIPASLNCGST